MRVLLVLLGFVRVSVFVLLLCSLELWHSESQVAVVCSLLLSLLLLSRVFVLVQVCAVCVVCAWV